MVASASIPYIYPSFKYQNQRLVDGGIVCNLPVDKLVNSPGVPKVGVVIHNNHVKVDADPSLITEASRVISMLLTAGEKDLIDLAMARRSGIVLIDASPFTILDTAMTVEQKTMLWTRGYDAARDR
jgi:predicted acylesterase/phospholipase RssA